MTLDEKIQARLAELISMGEAVLATRRDPPPGVMGDDRVDSQLAYQWATSTQSLLVRVFGQVSEHYRNFKAQVNDHLSFSPAYRAQGVLKAAQEDYERGQLFDVRRLIEADIFDSFLEQADHLLEAGYHQAAAVVAGGVLEDGLRKLCEARDLPLPSRSKLDTMNADLAKAGVFSKLVQKRVTTYADVRNKAAHGQWDQFAEDDVREMVSGVRRVVEEHLT
jgi:hypothetical protein